MNHASTFTSNTTFSNEAILGQVDKIFHHPDFSKSVILKKFLSYVVNETLVGNANYLKEYTIAVKVLEKPVTFNPQKSCIVRIHAGRLRNALSHYYNQMGNDDQIIIGIPKGKYVPIFIDRQQIPEEKKDNKPVNEMKAVAGGNEPVVFAVLPFLCSSENKLIKSFSENLCLQISSSLAQVHGISVIAYQAVKNLSSQFDDLRQLAAQVGFNYTITGGTQYVKGKIRINLQLIDCHTCKQLWSNIYECALSPSNLFEMQDKICQFTITQARSLLELTNAFKPLIAAAR